METDWCVLNDAEGKPTLAFRKSAVTSVSQDEDIHFGHCCIIGVGSKTFRLRGDVKTILANCLGLDTSKMYQIGEAK